MRRASDGATIVNVRAVLSLTLDPKYQGDFALEELSFEDGEAVDDMESELLDQVDTFAERALDKDYHWEYQDPDTGAWVAFEFDGTLVNDPPEGDEGIEEDDDD